ncbi:ECF transporter S component [Mesomycoplasma conjunctivae]|uniref:ECF transporter S component n=1 Tax=Mesomycoplasma conjunctivae TaxID=45361 RepID=UPI003DA63576
MENKTEIKVSLLKRLTNKKNFTFSIFEIVISGSFLAIFLVLSYIIKTSLPPKLNVAFEIPFFIFLGILLGWFKGPIVALLFDIVKTAATSNVFLWTPEYGIVPLFIALIAAFFIKLVHSQDIYLLIPTIMFILAIIAIFVYYWKLDDSLATKAPKAWGNFFNKKSTLILIGSVATFITVVGTILFIIYKKTNSYKMKLAFLTLMILSFIFIIFRWFWHPIAFIRYYNRYLNRSGQDRIVEQYFFYYLNPIILKSLVSLPIYTVSLVTLIPLVNFLNNKHNYQWRLGY